MKLLLPNYTCYFKKMPNSAKTEIMYCKTYGRRRGSHISIEMGRGIFTITNAKQYLPSFVRRRSVVYNNIPLNVMHHNTENNMTCLQKNVELTNCALSHLSKKVTRIVL